MSRNTDVIPFTELVERTSEIARERSDVQPKLRGYVNDVYLREIVRKWDWNFLLVSSTITVRQSQATGTVSANTGDTVAVFSGVSLDATYTGSQLRINGNDVVYDCVYQSATSLTIQPPLSGNQNSTNASYNLYFPFYPLPLNFDRFPKNGGFANWIGGNQKVIQETPFQEWGLNYSSNPSDTPERIRIVGTNTAGNQILEINPPPKSSKSYLNNYFQTLSPMSETTSGLISNISSGGTNVLGDTNCRFTQASTGDYLRIDALGKGNDSLWYRIISIQNDSALTLQTAFATTGITSANYVISSAPEIPVKLHAAILYGSVLQCNLDQTDPMYVAYNLKLAEVMSDGKRLYVSRNYNQQIHTDAEEYLYRY